MNRHIIQMQRDPSGEDHTFGVMTFQHYRADTMEDEFRTVKVMRETRIKAGLYKILLRKDGGMHQQYLQRFKEFHIGMLWLQDVPNFEWVYIHPLNFENQTEGCIGPGYGRAWVDGEPMVKNSVQAYTDLYRLVTPILLKPKTDELFINIKDAIHDVPVDAKGG